MRNFLVSRLSPFRHREFRLFFLVQTISLVGTWAHDLARSWIALDLMGRASSLGTLLLASAIPGLFLSLQGGVLVDRTNIRRVIIWTKALLAILALVVACVVEFAHIQMWHLVVFAFLEGCIVAFDGPCFQALTVRLVPRVDFQQAVALQSTTFHLARMLGPLIAGALMIWHGPSLVFLVDAISYGGLIIILISLSLRPVSRTSETLPRPGFTRAGLKYIFSHPQLRYMILQLFMTIALMTPLMLVVYRTFIQTKFITDAAKFGYLVMFPALGAACGAISFALFKPDKPIRALNFGVPLLTASVLGMAQVTTEASASFFLSLSGFALYLCFASLTVSLHLIVSENYRGRMASLITMGFSSIGPLMGFPVGLFADYIGYSQAMVTIACLFGFGSLVLALHNREYLRRPFEIWDHDEALVETATRTT